MNAPAGRLRADPRRARSYAECAEMARSTPQPSSALYSRTPEELTDVIFALCGPRPVTVGVRQPNERLHELVNKSGLLTAAEWAELTAFEREAG